MRMRRLILCVALPLLACGCASNGSLPVSIPGFSQSSDEEQVIKVLDKAHAGIQARSLGRVMAQVSPEYQDAAGRDYEALRKALGRLIKDYRQIDIKRTRPQVFIEGEQAKAIETFGTIAEPADSGKTPPLNFQGQVSVYLKKETNGWKIVEWGFLH